MPPPRLQGFLSPLQPHKAPEEPGAVSCWFSPAAGGAWRAAAGLCRGQRGPRLAGVWALAKSLWALFLFICSPEATLRSRRSKRSREEAMAKSKGRLYLWMCLAAALASFLAGFTVGKCTDRFPRAPESSRGEPRGRLCWAACARPRRRISARPETEWNAFGPS